VIYYLAMTFARGWISQGKVTPLVGFWWIQIPTALIALFLLWRSQQLPKPGPARAAAKAR